MPKTYMTIHTTPLVGGPDATGYDFMLTGSVIDFKTPESERRLLEILAERLIAAWMERNSAKG